jgi:hypothetical protein
METWAIISSACLNGESLACVTPPMSLLICDDPHLYCQRKHDHRLQLVTVLRNGLDQSASRTKMRKHL